MVLLAAVFASPAAATESETAFCQVAPTKGAFCPKGKMLGSGQTFKAQVKSGTNLVIEGWWETQCPQAYFEGHTTTKSGEPLTGEITKMNFGACNTSCTRVFEHLPYKAEFNHTVNGNGTVTVSNGGNGAPAWRETCNFGNPGNCYWQASSVSLTFAGGSPATLTEPKQAFKLVPGESWGWCPSQVEKSATYSFSTPSSLFLTAPES